MPLPRLFSSLKYWLRLRQPRPAILMYHRVAVPVHDPWGLAVDPVHFERQLAYLMKHRTVLSMDDFIAQLQLRSLPSNAIAITFDDGYVDNLVNAAPALTSHSAPATLFLPTGFVGQTRAFWWDELAAMILESTEQVSLELIVDGESVRLAWPIAGPTDISGHWRAWEIPRTERQKSYLEIWRRLQRSSEATRTHTMESLRNHLQVPQDQLARPMNADEIRVLLSNDLFTLGAHSISHPALTTLSGEERRREIVESAQQCRALTTRHVAGFAYPYGDMNSEVCADVAGSGLSWACSTRTAFIEIEHNDIYALPRIAVPDVSGTAFARLLRT
jgi:peptidoglycan/xylan/chitin deacetylase (PgdA/CDA1 family)